MPEPVAAVVGDHQQVVVHRLGERGLQVAVRQSADRRHQLVPHPPAGDGGDPHDLLGRGRALLHAGEQHVGQAQRQHLPVQPRRQQLLGVEGVALGPGDDVVDDGVGEHPRVRRQPAHQRADVVVRERAELQPLHRGQPDQLCEQRAQRVPPVQVVGAVGGDHRDALVAEPGQQVAQQVAARPVGPVHVLQHQQQRLLPGELADQGRDRLEQLEPAVVDRRGRRAVRQLSPEIARLRHRRRRRSHRPAGEQRGQDGARRRDRGRLGIGGHRAQEVHEGQVGQADVAQVDAVPGEHPEPALLGPGGELVEQPGLPYARVAGQENGPRPPGGGAVEGRQQAGELGGPSHHRRVVPVRHGDDRGTGIRRDRAGSGAPSGSGRQRRGGQRRRRRARNHGLGRDRVPAPAAVSTSRR